MDASKAGAAVMLAKLGADVVKTKANTRDLLTVGLILTSTCSCSSPAVAGT